MAQMNDAFALQVCRCMFSHLRVPQTSSLEIRSLETSAALLLHSRPLICTKFDSHYRELRCVREDSYSAEQVTENLRSDAELFSSLNLHHQNLSGRFFDVAPWFNNPCLLVIARIQVLSESLKKKKHLNHAMISRFA